MKDKALNQSRPLWILIWSNFSSAESHCKGHDSWERQKSLQVPTLQCVGVQNYILLSLFTRERHGDPPKQAV